MWLLRLFLLHSNSSAQSQQTLARLALVANPHFPSLDAHSILDPTLSQDFNGPLHIVTQFFSYLSLSDLVRLTPALRLLAHGSCVAD